MNATYIMPRVYYLGFKTGQTLHNLIHHSNNFHFPSWHQIWDFVTRAPILYKTWWLNLVANDPIHVFVETTLILSIIYILVARSKDWRDMEKEKLTSTEQEELLREWKETRAPLTPTLAQEMTMDIVVTKMEGSKLTVRHKNQDKQVLNFSTFDFLGMSANAALREAAHQALDKYGCGSCGPRGFYGTIDVHLQLEKQFSEFLGTDGAILYSDGASTCSSTVAAFCKRGDLLVVDDGIYEPLLTGVTLSRAHVKWFKHNDMQDLQRVLEQVQNTDRKLGRKPNAQRRFIVAEGLYKNTGTIAPLGELIQLKHQFSYRLILDESFSFGTLGPTGRGALELFDKQLMYDAEIVTISMENSMGSIGGITTGTDEVVEHQRLSGSGYCFSASSPPFTATAAMAALQQLETYPEIVQKLNENREYMYRKLRSTCAEELEDLMLVTSDEMSPIMLVQVADLPETQDLDELAFLAQVVEECLDRDVAVTLTGQGVGPAEPPPGIRLTVSASHCLDDIDTAVRVLAESVDVAMTRLSEAAS